VTDDDWFDTTWQSLLPRRQRQPVVLLE